MSNEGVVAVLGRWYGITPVFASAGECRKLCGLVVRFCGQEGAVRPGCSWLCGRVSKAPYSVALLYVRAVGRAFDSILGKRFGVG